MGLSLRKIGDFIGGAISGGARDVGHFATGVERQVNPFDNGATFSNPQGNGQQQSVVQQATPLVKGIVHPFSTFGSAILHVPEAVGLELQNKPISPVQQHVFGTTDPTNIAKQIVGDTATVGLTAAAPGLGKIIEGGVARALPGAASVLPRVAANAALGGTFNATNTAAQGGDLGQTAKAFGVGAGLGGAAPLVGEAIKPVVRVSQTGIENRVPLNSGGYAQVPFREPGETEVPQISQQFAHEYTPQQLIQQHADFLKNYEKNLKGGQIIDRTAPTEAVGSGYQRTTEHSPFYREYYAANKRPPSNTAWLDQATKELETGHGQLLDPGFKDAYDLAKLQESANAGIANNPSPTEPSVPLKTTTPSVKPNVKLKQVGQGSVQKPNISVVSGRELDPQALADLPPAEQMRFYGQEKPSTFNGPSLKIKSQQPETKLSLSAQTPKAAIGENSYIMGEHSRLFNNSINVGDKLSEGDKAKLSDALNGRDVGRLDNPELFNQTVDSLKGAYDNSLATNRLAGGKTARFNKGNFSPLYLKADTARLDELGVPKDQQYDLGNGQSMYVQAGEDSPLTAGKFKGYRNIQRKYSDYADAAEQSNGILQPANANALEDARMYANQAHRVLEGNLLFKQLKKLAPGEVSEDLNQKFGKNGQPLVHAANGQLPFNVTKTLNRQLTGFKSNKFDSKIGEAAFKTVEAPSKALRKVAFLGAPIHYANLTRSFLATTVPSGHGITAIRGIGEALGGSLHPKVYQALQDAADANGVREFAGKLGITDRDTRPNLLAKGTGFKGQVEKYSPFALQMRNLNRFNNVLGWKLAERVKELGIEPGTADATAIGTEINKVIDRINPKMEGLNPIGERLATSGSIAPHWIRANIGLVKDALKSSVPGIGTAKTGFGLSNAGDIARTNVIGGRILLGGTAILASALATGQMPTLSKALNEVGLNPNNPYPNIEGKSKTKEKYPGGPRYPQVTNLPSDPIGLAVGLLTDPKHFAIARETPALSAATQAITNQDFFGNPVVDKSQPGWEKKLAVATAQKLLPFSGQNVLNKSLTTGQKIEATVGLRTKTNPNDANYQQVQGHFSDIADVKKGLDTQAARAVDEYTASKKNPLTGKYITPNVNDTVAKARTLLQNPTAINALAGMYTKEAKKGYKVDPLWTQDTNKITRVLQYQAMPPGGADRTHWEAQNGDWYNKLADSRSTFFNSLPKGDPNKPQAPIAYPTPTPDVAAAQKQFFNITDSKERAQFLQEHPEVQAQLDAQVDYNNKLREAQGYSALDKFPTASPDVEKIINEYNAVPKGGGKKGGNLYRSQWITSHPDAYKAMSDYYTQASLYGLQHEAGQSQFADTGASQKLLKDAYNLGKYDIVKNKDGTYALGSSYSSSGSSGSGGSRGYSRGGVGGGKYVSRTAAELQNPYFNALDISAGGKRTLGKAKKPKVTKSTGGGFKVKPQGYQPKSVTAILPTKMKVKLKASKV